MTSAIACLIRYDQGVHVEETLARVETCLRYLPDQSALKGKLDDDPGGEPNAPVEAP